MSGLVSLVGAGPGDPDLLTMRAVARLREADLVLYDALVDPEALRFARRARRFFVGKRAGREAIAQETIHGLMIRAARRGWRVVRLKCGDPFVLGRGGEEALALAAAGIPCEVVPGVSSAMAAPALCGIPVTHRGLSSAFVVVAGHSPHAFEPVLASLAPKTATVVVLMGLANRRQIAGLLCRHGWPAETPAAIILGAASEGAHTWVGTMGELGDAPLPEAAADLPGTLVIGDVVSLATKTRTMAAPVAARMNTR